MKIIEILKSKLRINKIMQNLRTQRENHENHEKLIIYMRIIIIIEFHKRINKIIKILEFHVRIIKIMIM